MTILAAIIQLQGWGIIEPGGDVVSSQINIKQVSFSMFSVSCILHQNYNTVILTHYNYYKNEEKGEASTYQSIYMIEVRGVATVVIYIKLLLAIYTCSSYQQHHKYQC